MTYRCQYCGHGARKWMGFCSDCGTSEPLVEQADTASNNRAVTTTLDAAIAAEPARRLTGVGEVDRVLGGGLVAGSFVLVGGEPGVGKSTLLLQVAASLAHRGGTAVIVSAEESIKQVAMRARRLGVEAEDGSRLHLIADPDIDHIAAAAERLRPDLVVIDSIQSVRCSEPEGVPGGTSQLRESGNRLLRLAKDTGIPIVAIGHVTKDGSLAGPKLLEHMVDAVLSLEGDPDLGLRVLRAQKNRFGPTHLAGMFEMRSDGLDEVPDPSKVFLADWRSDVPGTVVFPAIEGRRSITVEVQALVVASGLSQPRRSVRGFDSNRIHQLLAVLQRHTGVALAPFDVYVNVVGGWRIAEPACDLPIALAVASSFRDLPLGETAAWGEIGLGGEIRPVSFQSRREEEARRLGVGRMVAPRPGKRFDLRSALLRLELW